MLPEWTCSSLIAKRTRDPRASFISTPPPTALTTTGTRSSMRFGPIPLGSHVYAIGQITSVEVVPMQTMVRLVMADGQRNELPASSPDAARAAILQAMSSG